MGQCPRLALSLVVGYNEQVPQQSRHFRLPVVNPLGSLAYPMTTPNKLLYGTGVLLLVVGIAVTTTPVGMLPGQFGATGPGDLGQDSSDQRRPGGAEAGTPASPPADDGGSDPGEDEPGAPRETSEDSGDGESGDDDAIEVGVDLL